MSIKSKRVTQKDVAKELGLSHATVSFALNSRMDIAIPLETRERIVAKAAEMGYHPNRAAQALVTGKVDLVGVRIPFDLSGLEFLQLVFAGAEARGLGVMVVGSLDFGVDAVFDWDGSRLLLLDQRFEGAAEDQVDLAWKHFEEYYDDLS